MVSKQSGGGPGGLESLGFRRHLVGAPSGVSSAFARMGTELLARLSAGRKIRSDIAAAFDVRLVDFSGQAAAIVRPQVTHVDFLTMHRNISRCGDSDTETSAIHFDWIEGD